MVSRIDEEVDITFRPEDKITTKLVEDEEDGLSIDASLTPRMTRSSAA